MKSKRPTLNQQQSYRRIPVANKKGLTALVVELCEAHLRRFPDDQFAMIWYSMAKIDLHQYAGIGALYDLIPNTETAIFF